MRSSLVRSGSFRLARTAVTVAAAAGILLADQVLETAGHVLTTYRAGRSNVQDVRPRVEQRGVNLDGSLRRGSTLPLDLAGNPYESVWRGQEELNAVRLDTGTWSPTEIDIALPAACSWVIGRSYNARQDDSGQYDSSGPQGFNWHQSSQPEIVLYNSATDSEDTLYLVYGADRFVEFVRTGSGSDTYKSKNGAAGVFVRSSGSPDTWALTDPRGTVATFIGFSDPPTAHDGQVWKVVDAANNKAYVGSDSSASAAISNGYDTDGRITTAYDSAGRTFAYSYSSSTIGGKKRLESVIVTLSSNEIARVEYDYYPDTDPTEGEPGDLRMVTTTLPLSDTDVDDVRVKYYRYYDDDSGGYSSSNRGYPHALKLVLEPEGARNYDWADADFNNSFVTETTSNLREYASAYFEYDSSHRIDIAWFNGQCGCGSAGAGTYAISYATTSYQNTSGYDNVVARRTVLDQPDSAWVTQYFDEVGQAMTRVVHAGDPTGDPAPTPWVTRVARDTMGCVEETGMPASVASYSHSGWSTTNGATGLVRVYDRLTSGDAKGFLADERWRDGTSATENYLRSYVYWTDKTAQSVGAVTLVRPLLKEAWEYPIATTTQYASSAVKAAYDYATYSGASPSQPLAIEKMDVTPPVVSTSNNGSGSATSTSSHYTLAGHRDFEKDEAGHITYREYTNGELTKLIRDANTASLSPPQGFSSVGGNVEFHEVTTQTYDPQGRPRTVTYPGGRTEKRYYTALADRRPVGLTFPNFVPAESPGPDEGTYYSPSSFTVANQSCKGSADGVIAFNDPTSGDPWLELEDLVAFIDEAYSDPIQSVAIGSVAQLTTHGYDKAGTQRRTTRRYFSIPSSLPGTDGTHYDETSFGYDAMGRLWRVKQPHGTITRTVYDGRGNVIQRWMGTNDHDFGGGEESAADNMVEIEGATFDANAYLTQRTLLVDGSNDRETDFTNDLFGRPVVVANPTTPHALNLYDNLGRLNATGMYSSTSGLSATSDPTSTATNRRALTRTYYDERGRVWKATRHEIDAGDGSDDDNLGTLTWYDELGRVCKVDGERLEKLAYDRVGRQTHRFVLASDDDADYGDVIDGAVGDLVLEEHQATFDADGKVVMEAAISRLYNDTGTGHTTGALDSNADGDPLAYTASDIEGRIQITASWHDAWDRLSDVVQFGTNDSTANAGTLDRDNLAVPTASETKLRTSYTYNYDGTLKQVTDPKGLVTRYEYDALGRRTKVTANYDESGGTPVAPGSPQADDNQTVAYSYRDGLQTALTADLPTGEADQVTTYFYGTRIGTPSASEIATGHLLRAVRYPDSTNTADDTYDIDTDDSDVVSYAYNRQGDEVERRDQAGNVIATDYDVSGRVIHRRVTAVASGFDDDVLRISTTYDSLGRTQLVTQYPSATVSSGSVVDEINYVYDGWGNLSNFQQDRDSAVGGSGYWEVAYGYEKATDGRNTIRRTDVTLPGSATYLLNYRESSTSYDEDASRVTSIQNSSQIALATYQYNGVGHVVKTTLDEVDIFSKAFTTAGTFGGLDRFDRTTVSRWIKDLATDRDIYKMTVGYDANSNVTSQDDAVHTGHDVLYDNDDLNRLIDADEGTLSSGSISSRTRRETWSLSQTGNWNADAVDLDGDGSYTGTGERDEERTHNVVNELTARDIDGDSNVDYDLEYDAAGNMTDDGEAYTYEWDAFYRLRRVINRETQNLVAEYWYNGLDHLITRHQDTDLDGDVDANDKKFHTAYDERWRPIATFRESDTDPKEQFLYHCAGDGGFGGSSYIDLCVLRDRDSSTAWTDASDGTLETRTYLFQNWRADVVALVDSSGAMVEWVKYSPYGVPFGLPVGDTDSDGDCDPTDVSQVQSWSGSTYDVRGDLDLDGDVDSEDEATVAEYEGLTAGRGVLTGSGVGNRKGYAGYEFDEHIGQKYHVRHRALDTMCGRWLSRDPFEYVDPWSLYEYGNSRSIILVDPQGMFSGCALPLPGGSDGGGYFGGGWPDFASYGCFCGNDRNERASLDTNCPESSMDRLDYCCCRHDQRVPFGSGPLKWASAARKLHRCLRSHGASGNTQIRPVGNG